MAGYFGLLFIDFIVSTSAPPKTDRVKPTMPCSIFSPPGPRLATRAGMLCCFRLSRGSKPGIHGFLCKEMVHVELRVHHDDFRSMGMYVFGN
jgi:hypothetical protein